MVWGVAIVVVLSACSFEHGSLPGSGDSGGGRDGPNSAAPWLSGYTHRKPVTITPPNTGPLTDFPIGIIVASDAQLASTARDDARDIVFTTADGTTLLTDELVSFGAASGALEAWVRIPNLPAGPSSIFIYYGSSPQNPAPTATWRSSFAGVWHLGAALDDSTTHNHPALGSNGPSTPILGDGIAGGARDFDGADDALQVGDPADGSLDFGTGSFSFSVWVRVTSSATTFDPAVYKGGATMNDAGYCVLLGSANWNMKVHDGTTYRDPVAGTETLGSWIYLAGVLDRTAGQMLSYRNGVLADSQSSAGLGSVSSARLLRLGNLDTTYYHGKLDELRISSVALTPDWIAAEYSNLTSPTFAVLGTEQTP